MCVCEREREGVRCEVLERNEDGRSEREKKYERSQEKDEEEVRV